MNTHLFPLLDITYTVSSLTTADSNYKEGKISITFALAPQLVFPSQQFHNYTDSSLRMIITSMIVPTTVVLVVVLMGIILVLGIVLVYLISKKSNTVKNTANQRLIPY